MSFGGFGDDGVLFVVSAQDDDEYEADTASFSLRAAFDLVLSLPLDWSGFNVKHYVSIDRE